MQVKQIIVYTTKSCPACQTVVPALKSLARKRGISVSVVDVEKCGKPCDWVQYVPLAKVDGKEENIYKVLRRLQ